MISMSTMTRFLVIIISLIVLVFVFQKYMLIPGILHKVPFVNFSLIKRHQIMLAKEGTVFEYVLLITVLSG